MSRAKVLAYRPSGDATGSKEFITNVDIDDLVREFRNHVKSSKKVLQKDLNKIANDYIHDKNRSHKPTPHNYALQWENIEKNCRTLLQSLGIPHSASSTEIANIFLRGKTPTVIHKALMDYSIHKSNLPKEKKLPKLYAQIYPALCGVAKLRDVVSATSKRDKNRKTKNRGDTARNSLFRKLRDAKSVHFSRGDAAVFINISIVVLSNKGIFKGSIPSVESIRQQLKRIRQHNQI